MVFSTEALSDRIDSNLICFLCLLHGVWIQYAVIKEYLSIVQKILNMMWDSDCCDTWPCAFCLSVQIWDVSSLLCWTVNTSFLASFPKNSCWWFLTVTVVILILVHVKIKLLHQQLVGVTRRKAWHCSALSDLFLSCVRNICLLLFGDIAS